MFLLLGSSSYYNDRWQYHYTITIRDRWCFLEIRKEPVRIPDAQTINGLSKGVLGKTGRPWENIKIYGIVMLFVYTEVMVASVMPGD